MRRGEWLLNGSDFITVRFHPEKKRARRVTNEIGYSDHKVTKPRGHKEIVEFAQEELPVF
jgi:hypothetical protein